MRTQKPRQPHLSILKRHVAHNGKYRGEDLSSRHAMIEGHRYCNTGPSKLLIDAG